MSLRARTSTLLENLKRISSSLGNGLGLLYDKVVQIINQIEEMHFSFCNVLHVPSLISKREFMFTVHMKMNVFNILEQEY